MNNNEISSSDKRGSGWAALDETFFALTQELFSRGFTALADGMLAANDNDLTERRASMSRHPSARRRF
ncbi:MAG: hypothetical protein JWN96_3825 [Mycobacterium sp.]|jgi:hypothetical protein|nr:hypothetical protein [Mycobacterium sp.]